jgi:uncharacterized protein YlzI (FlbEa/FlbD family)
MYLGMNGKKNIIKNTILNVINSIGILLFNNKIDLIFNIK